MNEVIDQALTDNLDCGDVSQWNTMLWQLHGLTKVYKTK